MKVSSTDVALCEFILVEVRIQSTVFTAGGPVQDGWTFLDVRPPHEIAKVRPAASWLLACARHAPLFSPTYCLQAAPAGFREKQSVLTMLRGPGERRRAWRARRRCQCTSWTRSGAQRWC